MDRKSLNLQSNSAALAATTVTPADYPLGSPQSRAAARALLGKRNHLPESDADALMLYGGAVYLRASMSLDYRDLESTEVYHRGRELHERLHGPVVPAHLDHALNRATSASLAFEAAFGREPKAGDRLSRADVQRAWGSENLEVIQRFIDAWNRQLPHLPCPLKITDSRVYRRVKDGAWGEAADQSPESHWQDVEREAGGSEGRLDFVEFLGVVDGKHKCKSLETR